MRRIAFLSTDNLDGFFVYDELLIPVFTRFNWQVDTVSWHDKTVNWAKYDAVIVRSTWDYQDQAAAFEKCLQHISSQVQVLENPLELMRWNMQKLYLRELEQQGVDVIPTEWLSKWCGKSVANYFDKTEGEVIIKPTLSANADNTFRLTQGQFFEQRSQLKHIFSERSLMIQPFVKSIVEQGEYSLFYFDGELSHSILKQPAKGDFRVQEEHGGVLSVAEPTAEMIAAADKAISLMPHSALYARVDLVMYQNRWRIMELELIEPSLYFQLDAASPERFVEAFLRRYQRLNTNSHS